MKIKYFVILLLVTILFLTISCRKIEPIDNYKGGIIYERHPKSINGDDNYKFTIRCNDILNKKYYFITVNVLKLDYDRYFVGDTIK